MDSYAEERGSSGSYTFKDCNLEEFHSDQTLQEKMAELIKTREELKRAKDKAMESWLNSRPLIDELEKLQAGLASAKNRTSMSNVVISELQSQLEATITSIRLRNDGESEANKAANDITRALDEVREELDGIKIETDRERRARSKMKQVLRMKRQKLRTLQLTLRAVRIEMKALGSSTTEAVRYINASETDSSVVKLTQEEYESLTRRAKEETALAQWRVSVSMEQKLAAEASRNLALSRLKDVYSESRSGRRKEMKVEKVAEEEGETAGKKEEEVRSDHVEEALPEARVKAMGESNRSSSQRQRGTRRTGSGTSGMEFVKQKKPSIFRKLKSFLKRTIAKLFG